MGWGRLAHQCIRLPAPLALGAAPTQAAWCPSAPACLARVRRRGCGLQRMGKLLGPDPPGPESFAVRLRGASQLGSRASGNETNTRVGDIALERRQRQASEQRSLWRIPRRVRNSCGQALGGTCNLPGAVRASRLAQPSPHMLKRCSGRRASGPIWPPQPLRAIRWPAPAKSGQRLAQSWPSIGQILATCWPSLPIFRQLWGYL